MRVYFPQLKILIFCLVAVSGLAPSLAKADALSDCINKSVMPVQNQLNALNTEIGSLQKTVADNTAAKNADFYTASAKLSSDQSRVYSLNSKLTAAQDKCDNIDTAQTNPNDNSKVDTSTACGHADKFQGSLLGENCQGTAQTIKNVNSRNDAVLAASNGIAITTAEVQAMNTSGNANAAQQAQSQSLKAVAFSKILQAGNEIYGAMQLHNAGSDAQSAADAMSGKSTALNPKCVVSGTKDTPSSEGSCDAEMAAYRLSSNQYDYLKQGSSEAQRQADAAKSAAMASGISGLSDGLTGIQALRASQMAAQNATGLSSLAPGSYGIGPANGGAGASPFVGTGVASTPPTDYGLGGTPDPTLAGTGSGGVNSSLMGGTPMTAANPETPVASTVSYASGGSPGGGGGGGGNGGANAPKKGGLGSTGVGEMGPGGTGMRAGGMAVKDSASDTSLQDMMKKFLNGDPAGDKKAADGRAIASGDGTSVESADGSYVLPSDLSIFQQVTTKLRKLNNNGQI